MGPGNRVTLFRILQESLTLSTPVPCHFQDHAVVSKWQPLGTSGPQFVRDAWRGNAFNSAFAYCLPVRAGLTAGPAAWAGSLGPGLVEWPGCLTGPQSITGQL